MSLGLVCYGIVHLLLAWLALQVAFGGSSQEASQSGALQEIASQPFGGILLWVIAVGLGTLTIWQLLEAIFGFRSEDKGERLRHKAAAAAKAVVYAALAVSAGRIAAGDGGSSGGKEESATSTLMSAPAGQILVGVAAVAVIVVGVVNIVKGVTSKFVERDLEGVHSGAGVNLGRVGYSTKGVVFVLIGLLLGWAAISHDPQKSGGLDDALKTLRDQPFGMWLLALVALGFACFGLYCFYWARHPKHS
ncbi:DUF1206 domain-containing protein [Epidermidibacterium keratini]